MASLNFIFFILGVLVGIPLTAIVIAVGMWYTSPIKRALNSFPREKGAIIEPESEELSQWVETLKTNQSQ
jgi:hypothetical protein